MVLLLAAMRKIIVFFLGKLMPFISSGKLDELLMQPRIYQNAQKHKKGRLAFGRIILFRESQWICMKGQL